MKVDLLPCQRALLVKLASPMVIRKTPALGPTWMTTAEIVSGVVVASGLQVPVTAPEWSP